MTGGTPSIHLNPAQPCTRALTAVFGTLFVNRGIPMLPATGSTAWRYLAAGIATAIIAIVLAFNTAATPAKTSAGSSIALYSATAEQEICFDNGECGVLTMEVESTRNGAGGVLCVEILTGAREERGCADVTHDLRVDADTGIWATLPTTSLDLYTLTCDDSGTCMQSFSRPVTIGAIWATDGPASGPTDQQPTCTWPNQEAGAVRPASLHLTIDDDSLRAFGSIRVASALPVADCASSAYDDIRLTG